MPIQPGPPRGPSSFSAGVTRTLTALLVSGLCAIAGAVLAYLGWVRTGLMLGGAGLAGNLIALLALFGAARRALRDAEAVKRQSE